MRLIVLFIMISNAIATAVFAIFIALTIYNRNIAVLLQFHVILITTFVFAVLHHNIVDEMSINKMVLRTFHRTINE
jgi:hypothetical protein